MSGKPTTHIVILDFSGTLSLAATRYGGEANLLRELKVTGLWHMGIDSPDLFWNQIVNPTWTEGSTTTKGYKRLLFERVQQIATLVGHSPAEAEMWRSAAQFVDRYFRASVIDPGWREFLRTLVDRSGAMALIATEHYAEATGHIIDQLAAMGIKAGPALRVGNERQVYVANSADIGAPKTAPLFWKTIQKAHNLQNVSSIVIVDDFGFNEQSSDSYSAHQKIQNRLDRTVEILSTIFQAKIEIFSFFLKSKTIASDDLAAQQREYEALIKQAANFATRALGDDAYRPDD